MASNTVDRELALQLLTAAVAADPNGKAGVGRQLGRGFGRSLISRVLSPKDPLQISDALATRVIDVYHVIPICPATRTQQARSECLRITRSKAPTHNPLAMRIWKTCQTCSHKPTGA